MSVAAPDRKSTRLNSSHLGISYAVSFHDCPSFPTRRSSDLVRPEAGVGRVDRLKHEEDIAEHVAGGVKASWRSPSERESRPEKHHSPPTAERAHSAANDVSSGARSEEHTSELQSLRHLVCRLLP